MSLEHSYSLLGQKQPSDARFSTKINRGHKRRQSLVDWSLSSSFDEECSVSQPSPTSACHPEKKTQMDHPLAVLFPDCILCLWVTNVYSHAVVADLHRKASEYAGNHRPHTGAYWACVDDWYEQHNVAELAPDLTKEDCVAHFTSNTLCRFNRQRCQPTLLFNHKIVSHLVDTFPSTNSTVFVNDQWETGKDKPDSICWCHNAFFSFLTVKLAKVLNVTLLKKKQILVYSILKRHTDSFISQWTRD